MKTLICIGDSLTEGADIPAGHSWPELVGNALNMDVINGGIGGDTTTGMLARFHPEVVARKPALVFILGGTNDLWWGLPITIASNNNSHYVFRKNYVEGLTDNRQGVDAHGHQRADRQGSKVTLAGDRLREFLSGRARCHMHVGSGRQNGVSAQREFRSVSSSHAIAG